MSKREKRRGVKRLPFLVNPPKGSQRAARKRARAGSSGAARRRTAPARRKRPPPAGFASWRDYMAHIRTGKKAGARRRHPGEGSTMATKRGKKKGGATRRRRRNPAGTSTAANPPRRRRRRRRNPRGMPNIPAFAMTAGRRAGTVLAGKIVARKVRGMIGQRAGSLLGSLVEAAAGVAGGLLLSTVVSPDVGADFAAGGVLAPMETLVQQAGIPHVSDSLGDDGYIGANQGLGYIDGGSNLGEVSELGEDVASLGALGDGGERDATLGRYVAGMAPRAA